MNPITPSYVAVSPDELQALNQIVQGLNERFTKLGAKLNGKTIIDRLFELADKGLKPEQMFKPEPAPVQDTAQAPERKFDECVYLIHFTNEESRIKNIRELMAKLDGEGWKSNESFDERWVNDPDFTFLRCYGNGVYSLYNYGCAFNPAGFPLHHWCGADPTKHRPKVKVEDRVVATTKLRDIGVTYQAGFSWVVDETDSYGEPYLPKGIAIGYIEGYRLATKYDV